MEQPETAKKELINIGERFLNTVVDRVLHYLESMFLPVGAVPTKWRK